MKLLTDFENINEKLVYKYYLKINYSEIVIDPWDF